MSRQREYEEVSGLTFRIAQNDDKTWSHRDIAVLVLQDIRGELQRIRTVLECKNTLDIPHKLDRIDANTRKPKKRKKT